jgi:hypothetical protein
MTMRQVSGLLKVINKSDLVEFYNSLLSYGTIHGAKLPTLNEFLGASLNKDQDAVPQFDDATDKILEAEALKRLNERRNQNV